MASQPSAQNESLDAETANEWFERNLAQLLGQSAKSLSRTLDLEDAKARSELLAAVDGGFDRVVAEESGVVSVKPADGNSALSMTGSDPVLASAASGYLTTTGTAIGELQRLLLGADNVPATLGEDLDAAARTLKTLKSAIKDSSANFNVLVIIDELEHDGSGPLARILQAFEKSEDLRLPPEDVSRGDKLALLASQSLQCFRDAFSNLSSEPDDDTAKKLAKAANCGPEVAEAALLIRRLLEDSQASQCALEDTVVELCGPVLIGGSHISKLGLIDALQATEELGQSLARVSTRGLSGISTLTKSIITLDVFANSFDAEEIAEALTLDEQAEAKLANELAQFDMLVGGIAAAFAVSRAGASPAKRKTSTKGAGTQKSPKKGTSKGKSSGASDAPAEDKKNMPE